MSTKELLQAVEKLRPSELDQFVSNVIALKAQRQAPHLTIAESDLLRKINQGLPRELKKRWNQLARKRDARKLNPKEYQELLHLVDQIEELQTKRVTPHLRSIIAQRADGRCEYCRCPEALRPRRFQLTIYFPKAPKERPTWKTWLWHAKAAIVTNMTKPTGSIPSAENSYLCFIPESKLGASIFHGPMTSFSLWV